MTDQIAARQAEPSDEIVEEAALLITCLRGLPYNVPGDMDWKALRSVAHAHRVLPIVYRSFLANGVVMDSDFAAAALRQKEWAENLARNLETLLLEFGRRGIEVIPLKGPALSQAIYGDATVRLSKDLDLLVRRKDFAEAVGLLTQLGFAAAPDAIPSLGAEPDASAYHFSFRRPDGNGGDVEIELHVGVAARLSFPFDLDGAWKRARPERFREAPMLAMTQEDLVLYLCIHGLKHYFSRLIWILDVAYVIGRTPAESFRGLTQSARRQGLELVFLVSCAFVRETMPQQMPAALEAIIAERPKAAARAGKLFEQLLWQHERTGGHFDSWTLLVQTGPSWLKRWLLRLNFLLPTAQDYAWVKQHGLYRGIAPIARPYRLIRKYGAAKAWQTLFPRSE